jgi:phenylacetate-CoA ligase
MNNSPSYRQRSVEALERALVQASAYRGWRALDPGPRFPVETRYAALPALTKREWRAHFPDGFLSADRNIEAGLAAGEIELVATSGSTEERSQTIWHQPWWDASERASWGLHGVAARCATGNHREAILVSPVCVGKRCDDGVLSMEERRLGRFLYLNEKADPLEWSTAHLARMMAELAKFQPVVLEANPSLLARWCRFMAAQPVPVYQPKLIVLTYEFPSRLHLRQIRSVFQAPIASSYGSTETGYVFMECEQGRLHQNTESCRVDFIPLKAAHGGPGLGRILVTPFDNPWCCLLRYDPGDLVRVSADPCPCGRRAGLTLDAVEGRFRDATLTMDGRLVTINRLDAVMSLIAGLAAYQLEQKTRDAFVLHVVAGRDFFERIRSEATVALRALYGAHAKIEMLQESDIGPEISGKYRLAKPQVSIDIQDILA